MSTHLIERRTNTWRAVVALALGLLILLVARPMPALAHETSAPHGAGAVCLSLSGGNRAVQSWVSNMEKTPGFSSVWTSAGGLNGERSDTTMHYSNQWLWYRVAAWSQDRYGNWSAPTYGNWMARTGQLGLATSGVDTWLYIEGRWVTSGLPSAPLGLGGPNASRPDMSIASISGPGWYYVEAQFYWGPISDAQGRTVFGGEWHPQSIGWIYCE